MPNPRMIAAALLAMSLATAASAQTPLLGEFSYQGRLSNGGVPVNGTADISVRLWDSHTGGTPLAFPNTFLGVQVTEGLFTITPNFGGDVFNGDVRWMETTVNGVTLFPRQMITPTPYALQTRGLHYNETEDFVGIGRENRVTPSEVFGIYKPGTGFGGMYVQTDAGGRPYYGYATGGVTKAFHYFDDGADRWKLAVGFRDFEFTTAGDLIVPGKIGIGVSNPGALLSVEGSENQLISANNDFTGGSTIISVASGLDGIALNGTAIGVDSIAVYGWGLGIGTWAGFFDGRAYVRDSLGVGTLSAITKLHVVESVSSTASPTNHVALIENTSTFTSPDVLALKINSTDLTPGSAINYITFFNDANSSMGSIQGNGLGGVEFAGPGGDYAEWLAHRSNTESFEPGDVVGVFGGKISKTTDGADQIMVISTQPIVVGNRPREDDEGLPGWEKVAFIGQASVQVRGPVSSGDFLIPSGLHDGTAIAVTPDAITPDQLAKVFATAWERSFSDDLALVNAAIGIDQAAASARVIEMLHSRQLRQQQDMESMRRELAQVKVALQGLLEAKGESQ